MNQLVRIASIATVLLALGGGAARAQGIPITIDDVTLTGTSLVDGVFQATGGTVTGTLAGLPFSTTIESLQLTPAAGPGGICSVLDLELAPIHLQLLGLHVDTSPICLQVNAIDGGGLLGELLCGLTGLDLGAILDGLVSDLPLLGNNSLLGTILTQVLGGGIAGGQAQPQAPGQGQGQGGGTPDEVCTGDCTILHLVLGPVDLNLLGLEVILDNCDDGPVEVCVSATRREGLLGALLCALAGPQLGGLNLPDIGQLATLAQSLLADGALSNADIFQLRQLLRQLL